MIGPKPFLILCLPLTGSIYLLLLNLTGTGFVSIWISLGLTGLFAVISIITLLRISEKEEEKVLSDQMHFSR